MILLTQNPVDFIDLPCLRKDDTISHCLPGKCRFATLSGLRLWYYDPLVRRFISADDMAYLGADGTVNTYYLFAYCENDSVNKVDDSGNFSLPNWAKVAIGAAEAALDGAVDGACDGFMWGGISAGAIFTMVASKGIKIREIGRIKPSGKSGDGYLGVKYEASKANGKYTTKSFELHPPHEQGPHNLWHWQQNKWNPVTDSITGSAKHWRVFGKKL